MKLDLSFEQNQQNINVPFSESGGQFSANFGETSVIHDGQNGATFIPSVSPDGIISWTNDRELPNPDPVNIKGAKGDKGDKGEQGERGLQGIQGVQGERGADGAKGDKGDRGEQGIQGEKGADGKDGVNGKDGTNGKDGEDGEDGFSPVVAVADIEGGHRVTITDKDGNKTFDVMDGKDGQGGTGGTSVQSDWNVNDESDPAYVKNRTHYIESAFEAIVWDGNTEGRDSIDLSLAVGAPAGSFLVYKISDTIFTTEQALELNISATKTVFVEGGTSYQTESVTGVMLSEVVPGVLAGTFDVDEIIDEVPNDFAAGTLLVASISGDFSNSLGFVIPSVGTYCIQQYGSPYVLNIENDTIHVLDDVFIPETIARTDALNKKMNADNPVCDGKFIMNTAAVSELGEWSFTEGFQCLATGTASHAEGFNTMAFSDSQHTQGKLNISDDDGKYAHIVGNGYRTHQGDTYRSNAHTLDWFGLGWFAGGLKVGGTGQDDPNAEEILTKSQVQSMIDEAIANLPKYQGEVEEV